MEFDFNRMLFLVVALDSGLRFDPGCKNHIFTRVPVSIPVFLFHVWFWFNVFSARFFLSFFLFFLPLSFFFSFFLLLLFIKIDRFLRMGIQNPEKIRKCVLDELRKAETVDGEYTKFLDNSKFIRKL